MDPAPQQKAVSQIRFVFMPERPQPDQNAGWTGEKIYWIRFKTPAEMFYAA